MTGPVGPRIALGGATFGLVAAVSYVGQRLLALAEPAPDLLIAQEHVPFSWRVGLALLHGVVAAGIVGPGARDPERALGRVPVVVAIVAPLLAVAALVAP